jgi:hypothetical protein
MRRLIAAAALAATFAAGVIERPAVIVSATAFLLTPSGGADAADLPISALPSATTPLSGTEVAPIVQAGTTKKVALTPGNIGALSAASNLSDVSNATTARTNIGAGTLSSITFNSPLTGGTLTSSGTVGLGTVGVVNGGTGSASLTAHGVVIGEGTGAVAVAGTGTTNQVFASNGAAADPAMKDLTTVLDSVLCSSRGAIAYRGVSSWVCLTPATNGQVLTTGGPGADPSYTTVTGTGTVTSITAGSGLTTTPGSTGGSITSSGTLYTTYTVNAQTGTSYTISNSDSSKLTTFSNASSVAVTLPQAGAASSFLSGWASCYQNRGAGTVTITPTTSTIDGSSSIAMLQNQGACIVSDGANYFTARGGAGLGTASTATIGTSGATVPLLNTTNVWSKGQSSSPVTLTDAATITPDFSAGNVFTVTLGGNRTLANPTNTVAGQCGQIFVTQDGTGSRTLAYGANWKFSGATAPTLTTTASRTDVISFCTSTTSFIAAQALLDVR